VTGTRDELEAVVHRQLTAAWRQAARHIAACLGEGREDLAGDVARLAPAGDCLAAHADAILSAADLYREGPPSLCGRALHLAGTGGAQTACRYRWPHPEFLAVTGAARLVTCTRCKRSRRYRDLTAGAA
jgi:hypothetical protein